MPPATPDPEPSPEQTAETSLPAVQASERPSSAIRETVQTLVLALLIFLAIRSVVLNFRVDGNSMAPTLQNGEMLIVNRRAYSHINLSALVNWLPGVELNGEHEWYPFGRPQRGDIVVFTPPRTAVGSEPYIKRIIGLPGDRVSIHDGAVYINGDRLPETYVASETRTRGIDDRPETVVSPGHVIVLGDNRGASRDSRMFGEVPMSNIIGKAWVTYWPVRAAQVLPTPSYPAVASP